MMHANTYPITPSAGMPSILGVISVAGTESNQAPCLSLVQFQIEQGELVMTRKSCGREFCKCAEVWPAERNAGCAASQAYYVDFKTGFGKSRRWVFGPGF